MKNPLVDTILGPGFVVKCDFLVLSDDIDGVVDQICLPFLL